MADKNSLSIIGFMDRLWFHQIILSLDSTTLLVPKTLKQPQLITQSLSCPSSILSLPTPLDEEISSAASSPSPPNPLQDDCSNEEVEDEEEDATTNKKERTTRLNIVTGRGRSHSSSPVSTEKRPKNGRHSSGLRRLQKSMSCRSLRELELEEVKGFMDLGFIFKQEHLSSRLIKVIPGLQRLGLLRKNKHNNSKFNQSEVVEDDKNRKNEQLEEEEEQERCIIRPYLSEAWLIRRPDSPLLNLKMPRVSASADMKKHLRSWARTVASVIQQES